MTVGLGATCMGHTLFVFSVIFFLAGQVMVPAGVTMVTLLDQISDQSEKGNNVTDVAIITAIFLTVLGFLLLLVCILGCCGLILKVRYLLGTYVIFVGILVLLELSVITCMSVFRNNLKELIRVISISFMMEAIRDYTGVDDVIATKTVDSLQQRAKCCGAGSYMDFQDYANKWTERNHSRVPVSCCVMIDVDTKDRRYSHDRYLKERRPAYSSCHIYPTARNSYIERSCVNDDSILFIMNLNLYIIPVLVALQMIGLIFAVCLIRMMGKKRAVPVVHFTEHEIEVKGQYEL